MNIQSALAACRSELLSLVKSIVRLLQWGVLVVIGVLTVLVLRQALHVFDVQITVAFGLMLVSVLAIFLLAKGQAPDRKTWIGVHAGIVAAGIAAASWVQQWSGYIVATILVLFAFTPNVLRQLAIRHSFAGYVRSAAFYARLACLFHPSRLARFDSSFLSARAFGSIEKRVAGYRALALRATPEQFALLNCWIHSDQGDWEGVLGQIRSAGDTMFALKGLEIRALGELEHVDEMIATYASAESILSARNLPFCRLVVLAFSGHADGVRSLLSRQLRFVRPRSKAYWIFIVGQAAGMRDEDARHILASHARAADDETFRMNAQRHLDAGPTPGGVALSTESRATIAEIEKTLAKTKRNSARQDPCQQS
jgi:hypothetical protein